MNSQTLARSYDRGVHIDSRELAWAAGLFEGEGSFSLTKENYPKPRAALTMSDEDSVRRFHRAVGVGSVGNPRLPAGGTKEVWTWYASKFEEFQAVVLFLWFGLGQRRRARAVAVLQGVRYVNAGTCKNGHPRTPENRLHRTKNYECKLCARVTRRNSYRKIHNVPEESYRK